ncbi:MAG: MFS transporter [Eubacteriales bacterium]
MNPKSYKSTLRACYTGYITQAIVVNLAPLFFVLFREDYGVSYSFLANLIFITFMIQIIVDALMVPLILRIGYRTAALTAHAAAFVGLVLLGVLPNFIPPSAAILLSAFFYSLGGGLIEVVISPIVDSIPGDAKASSMSLLHSFYSWGQMLVVLISTLVLLVIGRGHWYLLPIFWSIIPRWQK